MKSQVSTENLRTSSPVNRVEEEIRSGVKSPGSSTRTRSGPGPPAGHVGDPGLGTTPLGIGSPSARTCHETPPERWEVFTNEELKRKGLRRRVEGSEIRLWKRIK